MPTKNSPFISTTIPNSITWPLQNINSVLQVTLQPDAVTWCQAKGIPATTATEALAHPNFEAAVQAGIDAANAGAESHPKQVRKWRVVPGDFSVTGGELGPTLKLKRHVVAEKYKDVIQEVYDC